MQDLAPPDLRGRLFGYFRSVSDFGYIIGPLLLGWLVDATGAYQVGFLVLAAVSFASIPLMLTLPKAHPRRAPGSQVAPAKA